MNLLHLQNDSDENTLKPSLVIIAIRFFGVLRVITCLQQCMFCKCHNNLCEMLEQYNWHDRILGKRHSLYNKTWSVPTQSQSSEHTLELLSAISATNFKIAVMVFVSCRHARLNSTKTGIRAGYSQSIATEKVCRSTVRLVWRRYC